MTIRRSSFTVHRARQFERSFHRQRVSPGRRSDNGLLHVSLKRPVVETHSRTIEIKTRGKSKRPNLKRSISNLTKTHMTGGAHARL